ncbi:MAG: ATP-binding protein [Rhodocyclaceae bacterium]|nr:ATP-binding protein [Rhodocyclaceae bacterium]MDZ4213448.1 ATP-binding protein [Rhodocyclaceae bacterium]
MKRYLDTVIDTDLARKMVILTGPRQVGKTTLARQLMMSRVPSQYLNWDIATDRQILQQGQWRTDTRLLVMDEIHKMPDWKSWLKGVVDGRSPDQTLLVTGSARMETFRQSGASLAGRYLAWRLHPISVREWCQHAGVTPALALAHLMQRGGFPEPCLATSDQEAERWRLQYATDLVREDVLEFSRLQEVTVMRLFLDMLRERVGSPLSLASLARDLAVAPATLKRYLDILEALFIVFAVRPWHHNIGRAMLQTPKIYFYDNGMVRGDAGVRFENTVAGMLLKHCQFRRDALGRETGLHYIRTKDGAEVDFALSEDGAISQLVECKWADAALHRPLLRFAEQFPQAGAVQLVAQLHQESQHGRIQVRHAGTWLNDLDA